MKATIIGLGEWLPETIRENDAWPPEFREAAFAAAGKELVDIAGSENDPCEAIVLRRSREEANDPFRGARRRRVADESISSVDAEVRAARAALQDAMVDPEQLDLVLSWSLVPERLSPSNAPAVAHAIGAHGAGALGLDAACATTIAQLTLATAMIESGRARYVLLTQSHLISRANPMMHPASPNLGDAATAMVVGPSERPGVVATRVVSDGSYHKAVTWCRARDTDPPWWQGGPGFYPGSRDKDAAQRLARRAVRIAVDTIAELLAQARVPVSTIDVLASAQPRRWFPASVAEALGLPESSAPDTFEDLAHVGGCGVVTNLLAARRAGLVQSGARVVLYAMGAGMTRAAALVEWQPFARTQ